MVEYVAQPLWSGWTVEFTHSKHNLGRPPPRSRHRAIDRQRLTQSHPRCLEYIPFSSHRTARVRRRLLAAPLQTVVDALEASFCLSCFYSSTASLCLLPLISSPVIAPPPFGLPHCLSRLVHPPLVPSASRPCHSSPPLPGQLLCFSYSHVVSHVHFHFHFHRQPTSSVSFPLLRCDRA